MYINVYAFIYTFFYQFLGKHPFCNKHGNFDNISWKNVIFQKIDTDEFPNELLELCYLMLSKVYLLLFIILFYFLYF
jgi:hypothetical protein